MNEVFAISRRLNPLQGPYADKTAEQEATEKNSTELVVGRMNAVQRMEARVRRDGPVLEPRGNAALRQFLESAPGHDRVLTWGNYRCQVIELPKEHK